MTDIKDIYFGDLEHFRKLSNELFGGDPSLMTHQEILDRIHQLDKKIEIAKAEWRQEVLSFATNLLKNRFEVNS